MGIWDRAEASDRDWRAAYKALVARQLRLRLRVGLYIALVRSVQLSGIVALVLTHEETMQLEVVQTRLLRKLLLGKGLSFIHI